MTPIMHLVLYTVHDDHKAVTRKGDDVVHGSVHHHEEVHFKALVTKEHADGTADLVIFPRNKPPTHVDAVPHVGDELGRGHCYVTAEDIDEHKAEWQARHEEGLKQKATKPAA